MPETTLRKSLESLIDQHRYDGDLESCMCRVRSTIQDIDVISMTCDEHAAHVVERIFAVLNGVDMGPASWPGDRKGEVHADH